MDATFLGQIIIAAGLVLQIYLSERKRRWEMQDRRAVAAELEEKAKEVAATVKTALDEVTVSQVIAAAELKTELKVNTKVSRDAFIEANHLNKKIEVLTEQFNSLLTHAPPPLEALPEIVAKNLETSADTNVRVKRIEREVADRERGR